MSIKAEYFPALSDLGRRCKGQHLRICIVTPDLAGPVKSGGIGTACANLARVLASASHKVDILFTMDNATLSDDWSEPYTMEGISIFLPGPATCPVCFPGYSPLIMSLRVYEWLKTRDVYDCVLFMDWKGNGFYALNAKRNGRHFQRAAFGTIMHAPSIWHALNNATPYSGEVEAAIWHMERASIEMSDFVISPSKYMLGWCGSHGYGLPAAFWQPNPFFHASAETAQEKPIREVVFFGRLEYRKGLVQFCASMDILAKQGKLPEIITFLGKCGWVGEEHCLEFIGNHSQNWPGVELRLLLHFNNEQAVKYLSEGGRLAVMPSIDDNSPYTVYEALGAGIPFLARDAGGIAELVRESDRKACLTGDNPKELADKISALVGNVPQRAWLNFDVAQNNSAWVNGLQILIEDICGRKEARKKSDPFISVCLTHYNRPEFLSRAVQSLLDQEYGNFEVILADDGSDSPHALKLLDELEPVFLRKGWRILHLENGFTGRARNRAAKLARGEWLLFFDDDNVAKKEMLAEFALATQRDVAVINSSFEVFTGPAEEGGFFASERFLPMGNVISLSTAKNVIGDGASLVKKEAFMKIGGFREDYGIGHEDFELLLRLALQGEKFAEIPDSLFWYRRDPDKSSVNRDTPSFANRMRALRPFLDSMAPGAAEMAYFAHFVADKLENASRDAYTLKYDPQSDEYIEKIANELGQKQSWNMVDAIYGSLCFRDSRKDNAATEAYAYCIRLGRSGKYGELETYFSDFEKSLPDSGQGEVRNIFNNVCLRLLDILPSDQEAIRLRTVLADRLSANSQDNLPACLFLAGEYVQSNPAEAVRKFVRALLLADQEYQSRRPDVAAAIKSGQFQSGLHHFMLHGKNENMLWPESKRFGEALKKMDKLQNTISKVCATVLKMGNIQTSGKMLKTLSEL